MIDNQELLKQRYFRENRIWKVLDSKAPLFRLAQDPVFNLTEGEARLIEFLHSLSLQFTISPRYDPATPICALVKLGQSTQIVKIDLGQEISATCSFMTEKNAFAADLKGWLDRAFGSERYNARISVSTRYYVCYSYVLPIPEEPNRWQSSETYDARLSTHLFNFDLRERHFLSLLEQAVLKIGPTISDPPAVLVYPRQRATGSIELVIGSTEKPQPARVFVKGSHPTILQIITENTPLVSQLRLYLNEALGAESLDRSSCRERGAFYALLYHVRFALDDSVDPDELEELDDY